MKKRKRLWIFDMLTTPHLVHITPEAEFEMYHSWLSSPDGGMDRVRPISGLDELMSRRLGYDNWSKRCYAMVNERGGVMSVIYAHSANVPVQEASHLMLPGRVDKIVAEKSRALEAAPNVIAFYSISNLTQKLQGDEVVVPNDPNAPRIRPGKMLISAMYKEFTRVANPPILTTLSPIWGLASALGDKAPKFKYWSEEAKIAHVAGYIHSRKNDVARFHLGNGAQVGAIQFNANASGSSDDILALKVMVNYRYPRRAGRLEENVEILNSGRIPASKHLLDFFKNIRVKDFA